MNISFNIPDEKVQRIINVIKYFYPDVPEDASGNPLFTDNQWTKEVVRQHFIGLDQRYRTYLERGKINVVKDDSLLS